jgi:methylthioribulose-1-phosphate dehydratase
MKFSTAQAELASLSRELHGRGWVPATSGNFSLRLDDGDIAITASGKDKGLLEPGDIMRIASDGSSTEDRRPSAETALHTQLYSRASEIRCVLHTHSVTSTLISQRAPDGLVFRDLEILKAFAAIDTHAASIHIPVFANTQDIVALAARVETHMQASGQGVAYLIAGHGLYTWGTSSAECVRHLEALEYLFEYCRLSGQHAN